VCIVIGVATVAAGCVDAYLEDKNAPRSADGGPIRAPSRTMWSGLCLAPAVALAIALADEGCLTEPTSKTVKMIGPHQIGYEPETGFICLRGRGTVDVQQLEQLIAETEAHAGTEPPFILADDREGVG